MYETRSQLEARGVHATAIVDVHVDIVVGISSEERSRDLGVRRRAGDN